MSTNRNFKDLSRPLLADPQRAARVEEFHTEAVAEHIEYTLNELRVRLGISQQEMADRLGVTQGAVSQALRNPSRIDMLRRYVEALGGELEITVKLNGETSLINV